MILITGASGMLGKGVVKFLSSPAQVNTSHLLTPNRTELNLENLESCMNFFEKFKPEIVFHLGARVMGLEGNLELQIDSFVTNSQINNNLFQAMIKFPPKKIFFPALRLHILIRISKYRLTKKTS